MDYAKQRDYNEDEENDHIAIQIQQDPHSRSSSQQKKRIARQDAKNYDEFTPTSKNQFLQFTNQMQAVSTATGSSSQFPQSAMKQSTLSKVMSRL